MRSIPFLDLGRLHQSLYSQITAAMTDVINRSSFIEGTEVASFEAEFALASGLRDVAGCASGTDAISLALRALGIGPGDEVIVPSMTYVATAEAVVHVGARPVLADVDPDLLLLTEDTVKEVLTPRTRAVIPVHLYGHTVASNAMREWRDRGLVVVEDCAQAHLASDEGAPVGTIGHAAAFSFFPGKNLGAFGDAGAVGAMDPDVAREVRRLRNHGRREKYLHEVVGYASRLDSLQAAVLAAKLPFLEEWTLARRLLAERYRANLGVRRSVRLVPFGDGAVHHLLVVRVAERERFQEFLQRSGVATGVHYPVALSHQPALAGFSRPTPNAELAAREVVSLPIDPLMTVEEVDYVCDAIAAFEESP